MRASCLWAPTAGTTTPAQRVPVRDSDCDHRVTTLCSPDGRSGRWRASPRAASAVRGTRFVEQAHMAWATRGAHQYSYRSVCQRAASGVRSRGYCGTIVFACPLRMAGYASVPEGRTTLPRRSVPWKASPGHHGSGGRGRQSLTRRTPLNYAERKPCPKNATVIRKGRRNRP